MLPFFPGSITRFMILKNNSSTCDKVGNKET